MRVDERNRPRGVQEWGGGWVCRLAWHWSWVVNYIRGLSFIDFASTMLMAVTDLSAVGLKEDGRHQQRLRAGDMASEW